MSEEHTSAKAGEITSPGGATTRTVAGLGEGGRRWG